MDYLELQEMLDNLGCTVRMYSGRGMDGRECLAVRVPDQLALISLSSQISIAMVAAKFSNAEVNEVLDGIRTDSMGKGVIAYWPNVRVPAHQD